MLIIDEVPMVNKVLLFKHQIFAIIPFQDNTDSGNNVLNKLSDNKALIVDESGVIRSLIYYMSLNKGILAFACTKSVDFILNKLKTTGYIKVGI